MKRIILILIWLFSITNAFSQDYIVKKNGEKVICQITEISTNEIFVRIFFKDTNINTKVLLEDVNEYKKGRKYYQRINGVLKEIDESLSAFKELFKIGLGTGISRISGYAKHDLNIEKTEDQSFSPLFWININADIGNSYNIGLEAQRIQSNISIPVDRYISSAPTEYSNIKPTTITVISIRNRFYLSKENIKPYLGVHLGYYFINPGNYDYTSTYYDGSSWVSSSVSLETAEFNSISLEGGFEINNFEFGIRASNLTTKFNATEKYNSWTHEGRYKLNYVLVQFRIGYNISIKKQRSS